MSKYKAHLQEVYPVLPFEPSKGEGVFLKDDNNREVLDLYGGHAVACLGYNHHELTSAIINQAKNLLFQSNAVVMKSRDEAAEKLSAFSPKELNRIFFVNSGAEANENAIRIALQLTGRNKIIAIENAFHGRTAAAGAVTWGSKKKWYGFPSTPMEVEFVPRDDIDFLKKAIDKNTAALIIEPLQGVAGAYKFSNEFIENIYIECKKNNSLLIFDEVQTGIGRLGVPFGANYFQITPDLLTTAKSIGGGLPCGAIIMKQEIAKNLGAGSLGTTFGGGPLASIAISTVIDTINKENLMANINNVSKYIFDTCKIGPVIDIQGAGFLLGLKTEIPAQILRDRLLEKNIMTGTSSDPNILRLLPPFILNKSHVDSLSLALKEINNE
tara:strand:- start:48387 stop:49535 length:1149 start_codon:yes stop_codon:yes gene_type:complete